MEETDRQDEFGEAPEITLVSSAQEPSKAEDPGPETPAHHGHHGRGRLVSELPEAEMPVIPSPQDDEESIDITAPVIEQTDSKTTQEDYACLIPLAEGKKWNEDAITLVLPSGRRVDVQRKAEQRPNVEPGQEWMQTLQEGFRISPGLPDKESFTASVDREDSRWLQYVEGEAGRMRAAPPKVNFVGDDNKLTGEAAVMRVRQSIGLGGVVQIPLWHSGFWLTLKTPSDSTVLEMERRIADEKIRLGRMTNGAVFSNMGVFIANILVQTVIEHIFDTTIKEKQGAAVLDLITAQDLQHLAWGFALAIYPNGFQYSRSILGEGGKVDYTVKEMVALGRLQWTDSNSLTKWQKQHMSQRTSGSMTLASIQKYRDEFALDKGRKLELNEVLSINLKSPSIREHLDSGQQWVDGIVTMVDRAFGLQQDPDERNRYIWRQGQATIMRDYAHFVASIEVGNGVIESREDINNVLSELSSNDEAREKFFDGVRDFIDDTCYSVIAVPSVDEREENKLPRHPHLVPIDAVSVFFILVEQAAERIYLR